MLDITEIRANPAEIAARLNRRDSGDFTPVVTEIVETDKSWRSLTVQFETMRAEQRKASDALTAARKAGTVADDLLQSVKTLAQAVKDVERQAAEQREKRDGLMLQLPNLPDPDIAAGGKEANSVHSIHGTAPAFAFAPKDHVDLCRELRLIDYDRGIKVAGSGHWVYRGIGARLEWALINYFVSSHLVSGYEFILPPHILSYESGVGAGQFPKFEDDVFMLSEADEEGRKRFMLPTSETALINLFRDEILDEERFPLKLFAYTPCYRKEAGSHRAAERGSIRGHQFNKVEMFHFALPEGSDRSFDELVEKAVTLVNGLGLHFRVAKLAAGDISASMGRTYDIEVFIPSLGYKEVSSVSNGRAYQARRANVRYRPKGGKPAFVHTLNGSGLATSRLLPAIVEQFQQADGTVVVPEVLRPWVGTELLRPDPQGW